MFLFLNKSGSFLSLVWIIGLLYNPTVLYCLWLGEQTIFLDCTKQNDVCFRLVVWVFEQKSKSTKSNYCHKILFLPNAGGVCHLCATGVRIMTSLVSRTLPGTTLATFAQKFNNSHFNPDIIYYILMLADTCNNT